MTKRQLFYSAIAALPAIRSSRLSAQSIPEPPSTRAEAGAIVAHLAGRAIIDIDGTAEIVVYISYVDGLGVDLFAGQPGERFAHLGLRTDRIRPVAVLNGDLVQIVFQPVDGESAVYRLYYHASPNRDFARPDSFSDGQLVAVWRARRILATLVPGAGASVSGTVDLVESTEFTFAERRLDASKLFGSLTLVASATSFNAADIGLRSLSLPFAGYLLAVGENTRKQPE